MACDVEYLLCPDVTQIELELERIPREWFGVLVTPLLLQLAVSVLLIMNLPSKEAFTCAIVALSRLLTIGLLVLLRCLDYTVR
jgi:hypothetical protein